LAVITFIGSVGLYARNLDEEIVFGVARNGDLKNSLLVSEEFLDAKKLRTLQGANQNSSLRSSDSDLLERGVTVLVFWLKFLKFFADYFFNLGVL